MRYRALATDYDGTLAHKGRVEPSTVEALEKARSAGLRLILATGRVLGELLEVCPCVDLFDRIVAENGALLYRPFDRSERILAEGPPSRLLQALADRGVSPVARGRVIVAIWRPHETAAAEAIAELNLKHDVILNKRAVMILPAGVDKASGLRFALAELGLSAGETVAVGDAENDATMLESCGLGAAVANALPALKERARLVLEGGHGAGVIQLVEMLAGQRIALLTQNSEMNSL